MLVVSRAGSGEPMILVHGIGSNRQVWDRMRPALDSAFDVTALDLPGFGESAALEPEQRTTFGLADAVEAEMERQGFSEAHLVGNSMGGWIVLELARRGRARTVTAISPVGGATRREARISLVVLQAHRIGAKLGAPFAGTLSKSSLVRRLTMSGQMTRPQDVPPEIAAFATRSLAAAESWSELVHDISRNSDLIENNAPRFAAITAPVLITWGRSDRVLTRRLGPRLQAAIPGSELRVLPGVGHVPMLDQPDLIARIVIEHAAARAA